MTEKQHDERHRKPEDLMIHAPIRTVLAGQIAQALARNWGDAVQSQRGASSPADEAAHLLAVDAVLITDALLARLAETDEEKGG